MRRRSGLFYAESVTLRANGFRRAFTDKKVQEFLRMIQEEQEVSSSRQALLDEIMEGETWKNRDRYFYRVSSKFGCRASSQFRIRLLTFD